MHTQARASAVRSSSPLWGRPKEWVNATAGADEFGVGGGSHLGDDSQGAALSVWREIQVKKPESAGVCLCLCAPLFASKAFRDERRTSVFSDTPSAFARVVKRACTVLGTRATNFADATPPLFGAGIDSSLAFSAAIVAFKASFPFVSASSTVSPSERPSEKSG